MSAQGSFECQRCATCCRNLLEEKAGAVRGLTLTETETQLFPAEMVLPKLAVGETKPEVTILYQLDAKSCPHITKENSCPIYEKKPLMCRSFPVVAGAISNRCRFFSYRKVGVSYSEPFHMKEQLQASDRLTKHIQNSIRKKYKKGLKLWEFDLNTKKWLCVTEFNEQP
jgi:Fe-S-cluster containining protein